MKTYNTLSRKVFLLTICTLFAVIAQAHTPIQESSSISTYDIRTRYSTDTNFTDTLKLLRKGFDQLLQNWEDPELLLDDLFIPSEYYKLVVPMTYYKDAFRQSFTLNGWKPTPVIAEKDPYASFKQVPNLEKHKTVDHWLNKSFLKFYLDYPQLVRNNEEYISEQKSIPQIVSKKIDAKNEEILSFLQPTPEAETYETDLIVLKPNFWRKTGNGFLQFTQTNLSDNWYKGGESTLALLAGFVLQFNYDDQQKTQWDNVLEWRLGISTSPSDTLHKYNVNHDVLRFASKLGYRAFNNFYYTLSAEVKTQLFSNYAKNSNNLLSSAFSPTEFNVGLGLNYKYVKDKVCNLSVLFNPINYTVYSIMNNKVDPTKFNIPAGKKIGTVIGSRAEVVLKWKLMNALLWESRLAYTTNYAKAIGEWENTFSFAFNKYLSTKLFVLARLDDGVSKKGKYGFLQYQELLSFGLNYVW